MNLYSGSADLSADRNLNHSAGAGTGGSLSAEHRAKLRSSALTDQQIAAIGYWSDHKGHLQIPYRQPDGSPQTCRDGKPFVRFRLSDAEIAADPKAGKYRTRKGEGCRLYHSPLAIAQGDYEARLNNVHTPLRITEGEHKTNAAAAHDPDRVTIGLGGVNSWVDRYDGGDNSRPLVDLEEIPMVGREVRLCFDSDIHKPTVRGALEQLAQWLRLQKGAHVRIELLPNAMELTADGSPVRLGLDDLIHHHGAPFFLAIAEAAEPAFVIEGRGKNAQEVFKLPGEPSGTKATFRRALWLHGLIGHEWRANPDAPSAWWRWTGTHWERVSSDDHLLQRVEVFLARQNWREARAVGAVRSLAAAFRRMVGVLPDASLRGLVPCQNGVLRLSDRALLPHSPALGNRWALPIDWRPDAPLGPIGPFLKEALVDDQSVAIFRAAAHSAITATRRKIFLEVTGPADSGKSVISALLSAVVGLENTRPTSLDQLESKEGRFETARLRDKLLVTIPEAQRYNGPLETLKALTGGDEIRAELKGSMAAVDFYFDGLVVVTGNAPIKPSDQSAAVINRRRSITTPRAVPVRQQRPLLDRRGGGWEGELAPYLPGLLAWILAMTEEAASAALARDVTSPARIEAEMTVLLESDAMAAWAEEVLIFDPDAVPARVGVVDAPADCFLYPNYRRAIDGDGGKPLSVRNFKAKLVGLLRDALGLDLPAGSTAGGLYRARAVGSVVPCIRFRSPADGDAPGAIRSAFQARMFAAERMGTDAERMGTDAERQKPSEDTDGTDGTDRGAHSQLAKRNQEKTFPPIGRSDLQSVTSVPSVPGQGSWRSPAVPIRSRSVPDPFPWPPEPGQAVAVVQPGGSTRNGWEVASVDADGLFRLTRADGSKGSQHVRLVNLRPCSAPAATPDPAT
jgi:phage/plasmid-associated DNA primase